MKYRLANPDHHLPLPWRGGRLFDVVNGEEIGDAQMLDPFCRQLIKDGDIVAVAANADPETKPASKASKPTRN